MSESRVTRAADLYLDVHGHSTESYEKVMGVLQKFEYMVQLATERALEELAMDNVIPFQRKQPHVEAVPPSLA